MKIIQLFLDDKFVDSAIEALDKYLGLDILNVVISNANELKYIKSKNITKYSIEEISCHFSELIKQYDFVFFHSLPSIFRKLVLNNDKKNTYCWLLWGFDYYNEWKIESINLYEDTGSNISINKLKDKIVYNHFSYRLLANNLLKKYYDTEFKKTINLIDYVAPVLPNEFEKIKKINPKVKYLPYTYGYLEKYIGDNKNIDLSNKRDILLGNSADPSNNHISILYKLSKINLEDRKVIVPLSYAGNENYKNNVINYGYKLLGDKFVPLIDFMPIKTYNSIVFNCGIVIFNHIRQQAIGNLIVMGYLGAKIFLHKNSVSAEFLNSNNVNFRIINDINYNELNTSLKAEEINHNKNFYYSYFSKAAVEERINTMLIKLEDSITDI